MHCPFCSSENTKVNDSRISQDGLSVRRRRECVKCGKRFSTLEEAEILDLTVIKNNGKRESYNKDKLLRGIQESLKKRKHSSEEFHALIQRIERDIQKNQNNEISSEKIGKIVMQNLKKFDKIAFIRFASVYQSFDDILSFQKEVEKLKNKKS